MIALTKRFRRLVVCLAGVIAFLLTGCKVDGSIEFQTDGRVLIDLIVEDSDGKLTKINQTCEALRIMVLGQVKFIKNPKIEDITPPGGHTTCKVTSNEPFVGGFGFKETKDTYSFVFPNNHLEEDYSDFKTRIIVTMPGKVLKTTKGKVDGNKVIINSLNFANTGISITARKGQGTSVDKSAGSSGGRSGVSSASVSDGLPVWGWVGVGAVAVAVVVVVAFITGRKKRAAAGASGRGGPGTEPAVQQELAPRGRRPH